MGTWQHNLIDISECNWKQAGCTVRCSVFNADCSASVYPTTVTQFRRRCHKPSSVRIPHRFLRAAEWWLCSNPPVQRRQLQCHISSCIPLQQVKQC